VVTFLYRHIQLPLIYTDTFIPFPIMQIGTHLQARVAASLRSRHDGALPQPLFMEEGSWIEMTGVPLITTEGVAADGAEGGGAETGRDSDHGAEVLTRPGAEATHDDVMERAAPTERDPTHETEDASGAECATLAVNTPRSP
jgi:hypothetical protein